VVALRSGWIAVVLALLFLVPMAPTTGPASPAVPENPSGESIVRIHVAPSEVASLGPGVEVVEAYDTFVLARASAEAVARLSDSLATQAGYPGTGCSFYGAALAELLRVTSGFEGAMVHEQCRGQGEPYCTWRSAEPGGYE